MSFNKSIIFVAALVALANAAGAQTAPTPASPPAHHSLFGNMFHKHPAMTPGMHPGMTPGMQTGMHPGMMGMHHGMAGGGMMGMHHGMTGGSMMGGGIIGNKNSHVYHMPGDKGSMPSAANRVYFHSEQEAIAAGYHAAGSHGMSGGKMHTMKHQ